MRKHISFSIAATIAGLATVFWAIGSVVYSNADIVRAKVELSSSISHPHLQAQVLAPIFYGSAGADKLARDRSMIPRRGLFGVARALRPPDFRAATSDRRVVSCPRNHQPQLYPLH